MAEQFVGSMVSINCGEVLGFYQGLLDAVDGLKQTVTIVSAFHNGARCSVPRITINAADIHDLKIVKGASEAKGSTGVVNKYVKNVPDATPSGKSHENGKRISPASLDHSIVSFHLSSSDAESSIPVNGASLSPPVCADMKTVEFPGQRTAASQQTAEHGQQKPNATIKKSNSNSACALSPYKPSANGLIHNNSSGRLRSTAKSHTNGQPSNRSPSNVPDASTQPPVENRSQKKNGHVMSETEQKAMFRKRTNSASELYTVMRNGWKGNGTRQERHGARGQGMPKQEDCFAVPIDTFVEDDFDFEKNLALFDKRAVFDEIERDHQERTATYMNGPSAVGGTSSPRPSDAKFRCDENVLPSKKAVYRQIVLPGSETCESSQEYITDSGLIVPSVTAELRARLFEIAEHNGYDYGRRVEMVGRSSAEMVLQLLGGGNRFDPKNVHQCPKVVLLCGSASRSAVGISCARHLAVRNISVTVFIPDSLRTADHVKHEIKLLSLCGGHLITSSCNDLPTTPVDMIVVAFDDSKSDGAWNQPVIQWANASKAPVLALDPPAGKIGIAAKCSLAVALPLAFDDSCGQIYLCDLGLPRRLYQEAGVAKYQSPFAHKFVIPLYAS